MAEGLQLPLDSGLVTEPRFSAEEMFILHSLDPKFRLHSEKEAEQVMQSHIDDYTDRVKKEERERTGKGVRIIGGKNRSFQRKMKHGGFAVTSTLSALSPIIIPVVNNIINKIAEFFKRKRGSGVLPVGYWRTGRGAARLEEADQSIPELRGRAFWKSVIAEAKRQSIPIAQEQFGLSQGASEKIVSAAANQVIPNSFQQFVNSSTGPTGSGKKSQESQVRSVINPVGEWMLSKASKALGIKTMPPRETIRNMINKHLMPLDKKYAKVGSGVFLTKLWKKVKKYGKRILSAVLPAITKIAKEELPEIVDHVANKINISDSYKDPMKKFAKAQIPAIVDKLHSAVEHKFLDEEAKQAEEAAPSSSGSGRRSKRKGRSLRVAGGARGVKKTFRVKVL